MARKAQKGYTLIELVMVILLLGILAAVAIPDFFDFRIDAKNAATHGALGAMRASIAVAAAAIVLKEDPANIGTGYPTYTEIETNQLLSSEGHPVLDGTAILDPSAGVPANPWTVSTANAGENNTIYDCNGLDKGLLLSGVTINRGWCYNQTTGQIWPNSALNGDTGGATENTY